MSPKEHQNKKSTDRCSEAIALTWNMKTMALVIKYLKESYYCTKKKKKKKNQNWPQRGVPEDRRSTIAVEHPENPSSKSFFSRKKSDLEPANQSKANITPKYFQDTRKTGERQLQCRNIF